LIKKSDSRESGKGLKRVSVLIAVLIFSRGNFVGRRDYGENRGCRISGDMANNF